MAADTPNMLFAFELFLAVATLLIALSLRPWRMLRGPLLTPFLAGVVLLPWSWLLPQVLPSTSLTGGVSVQLSGACLLTLLLGWPLAIVALFFIAGCAYFISNVSLFEPSMSQWVWLGIVPATLALGLGVLLRRILPDQVFVYILGRGFIGTAVCMFAAGLLYELLHHLVGGVTVGEALVARWLMAWGDAFLTGMLVAIFVAFKPEWLATWSDRRYLQPPHSQNSSKK